MDHVTSPDAQSDPTDSRQHLATAVRKQRLALGLSVRAAAEAAGIARGTWIALEDGTRRTLETAYAGIERALCWVPGSVNDIISGGSPTPATTGQVAGTALAATGALAATTTATAGDDLDDDPLMRVMNSSASAAQKKEIMRRLIAEQREFAQRRVDELLREALDG